MSFTAPLLSVYHYTVPHRELLFLCVCSNHMHKTEHIIMAVLHCLHWACMALV